MFFTKEAARLSSLIAAHKTSFQNRVTNWLANGKKKSILLACKLQKNRIWQLSAALQWAKETAAKAAQLLLPAPVQKPATPIPFKTQWQAMKAAKTLKVSQATIAPSVMLLQLLQRAQSPALTC